MVVFKMNNHLDKLSNLIIEIKHKRPIVHCITNNVTINDCANALLSIGASPIMTNSSLESEDITSISNSLVLNIGTLNENQIDSMITAGKKAKKLNIPIVLDPVGVGSSKYRNDSVNLLLDDIEPDIIRGNLSEIKYLINMKSSNCRGVDASFEDNKINPYCYEKYFEAISEFSNKKKCIVIATGETDIICYNKNIYLILNGCEELKYVTGSGCMLTSIIGGFAGMFRGDDKKSLFRAAIIGTLLMAISGEKSKKDSIFKNNVDIGTFHNAIFNYLHKLTKEEIIKYGKIQKY